MTPDLSEWKKTQEDVLMYDTIIPNKQKFCADIKASSRGKAGDQINYEDAYEEIKISRSRTPYCLVTINPKPDVDLEELRSVCEDAFSEYFAWYIWSYEIRSAPDKGIHCHCVARILDRKNNTNFYRFKTKFSTIVGNPKHVDIRFLPDNQLEKSAQYVKKETVAKSKQASHEATIAWREENDIEEFYFLGDVPTCLVADDSSDEDSSV